jgi:two-component system response regulator AlgR
VRLLVVDDAPPARARLLRLLADLGHADVREAHDAAAASSVLHAQPIDVVLLDVTMPGMDGLSFAAHERLPVVIFVTGDAAHAARAFDVEAADFLVKPVTRERLSRALDRAKRRAALDRGAAEAGVRLRVLDADRERFVDARRIDHLRADAKYVAFDDAGREALVRESLDTLEPRLPDHVRVHRAHLVRLAAIVELRGEGDGTFAVLSTGVHVPVSRRSVAALRARLRR